LILEIRESVRADAYELYRSQSAFFPIIALTLVNEQDGVVYANRLRSPDCFYVEHSFGFSQVFGNCDLEFEESLKSYLVVNKKFASSKVRLYGPNPLSFLKSDKFLSLRSERQRFVLADSHESEVHECGPLSDQRISIQPIRKCDLAAVDLNFGVVGRFWRNGDDFQNRSLAMVAWNASEPVAICYAAAIADSQAEIDVITMTNFRRAGFGKQVVLAFNQRCLSLGIKPVWDCFTNNTGSMALCRSTGFSEMGPPYHFYTFGK
jgi:hypothetical protein